METHESWEEDWKNFAVEINPKTGVMNHHSLEATSEFIRELLHRRDEELCEMIENKRPSMWKSDHDAGYAEACDELLSLIQQRNDTK
jgi:hypothetical protein